MWSKLWPVKRNLLGGKQQYGKPTNVILKYCFKAAFLVSKLLYEKMFIHQQRALCYLLAAIKN